ncbi:hypothetical protein D3C85_1210170 [compost metagenome]
MVPGNFVQAVLQQRALYRRQPGHLPRAFFEHPVQAAIGLAFENVATGGQMQVGEQFADLGAMLAVGLLDVLAGQSWLQQRRLAGQLAQGDAVCGTQGIRHWQVGIVQHIEQFDEKRQILHRAALDQGQDKLALLQADEEIAVFGAGGDPLEITQAAKAVRGKKGFQLRPGQGSED